MIGRFHDAHPRSRQTRIGPSEAGTPCTRRLAWRLLDWPAARDGSDPWAAVQGTAVHAWLADAYRAENHRLGYERYLVEHRVYPLTTGESPVPGVLAGSCDLYDRDAQTVVDWKLSSPDRIRRVEADGPGQQYRQQAHLYGRGLIRQGEHVETVAICFLPRAASLDGAHVWSEPYSWAVSDAAIARLQAVTDALAHLDPEENPGRWALFPTAPDSCRFCPWLRPGSKDLAAGCPGHENDADAAVAAAQALIA